jgi:hypothetical protein
LRALDQVALEGRNLPRPDVEEARRRLVAGDDPWLRVVAAGRHEEWETPAELQC